MMFIHMRKALVYFTKDSSFLCKSLSFGFCTIRGETPPVSACKVFEFLIHKHQFSPQSAARVASVLTRLKNPQQTDSMLSFLKDSGFSNTHLEKIVEYRPRFLGASLEKVIKPKIKIFQDLGFSAHDIAEIIAENPDILHRSAKNRVIPSLSALKGLLGSSEEVVKVLKFSGWYLKYDIKSTLVPNFEFLRSCEIPMEYINWLMYNFPRSLLCKTENMRKFTDMIDEAGIKRNSKMFVHALRVLSSMTNESWELKLQAFRNLGFSDNDIVVAFRKAPQVFSVSEEKMKKLKEVLVETGKYDVSCIINNPTSLICSIERRYKPRIQVLRILLKKNLIIDWPCFARMFKTTDRQFSMKYIDPYRDDLGEVSLVKRTLSGNRKI